MFSLVPASLLLCLLLLLLAIFWGGGAWVEGGENNMSFRLHPGGPAKDLAGAIREGGHQGIEEQVQKRAQDQKGGHHA